MHPKHTADIVIPASDIHTEFAAVPDCEHGCASEPAIVLDPQRPDEWTATALHAEDCPRTLALLFRQSTAEGR